MAVRKILSYPEAKDILKAKSVAVKMNDPELPGVIQDLKDTLLNTEHGIGLAAPQIGVLKRIFVLNKDYIINNLDEHSALAKSQEKILIFINPKMISRKGVLHEEEGCLSVTETYVKIERARLVKVRAVDEQGQQFYEKFKDLAARAVQQEIDHLNGVLIVDYK